MNIFHLHNVQHIFIWIPIKVVKKIKKTFYVIVTTFFQFCVSLKKPEEPQ